MEYRDDVVVLVPAGPMKMRNGFYGARVIDFGRVDLAINEAHRLNGAVIVAGDGAGGEHRKRMVAYVKAKLSMQWPVYEADNAAYSVDTLGDMQASAAVINDLSGVTHVVLADCFYHAKRSQLMLERHVRDSVTVVTVVTYHRLILGLLMLRRERRGRKVFDSGKALPPVKEGWLRRKLLNYLLYHSATRFDFMQRLRTAK